MCCRYAAAVPPSCRHHRLWSPPPLPHPKLQPCTRSSSANKSSRVKVLRSTGSAHPGLAPRHQPCCQTGHLLVSHCPNLPARSAGYLVHKPPAHLQTYCCCSTRQVRTRSGAEKHQAIESSTTNDTVKSAPPSCCRSSPGSCSGATWVVITTMLTMTLVIRMIVVGRSRRRPRISIRSADHRISSSNFMSVHAARIATVLWIMRENFASRIVIDCVNLEYLPAKMYWYWLLKNSKILAWVVP